MGVWGFHGLAFAAERGGGFLDAARAFEVCTELIAAVAPGSGYELKYRMMLLQCLSRQILACAPGVSATSLKQALREAEDAHVRCYGGGARHFLLRMKKRLDEVFAALRRVA